MVVCGGAGGKSPEGRRARTFSLGSCYVVPPLSVIVKYPDTEAHPTQNIETIKLSIMNTPVTRWTSESHGLWRRVSFAPTSAPRGIGRMSALAVTVEAPESADASTTPVAVPFVPVIVT